MTSDRDVLFVTQNYLPEIIGSAPFCADIAQWLKADGAEVRILTGRPYYPRPDAFPDYQRHCPRREIIEGIEVLRLPGMTPGGRGALRRILGEVTFLGSAAWGLLTGQVARSTTVLSLCPSVLDIAIGCLAVRRGGRHVAIVHDIQSGLAEGLGMVSNRRLVALMRWTERVLLNRVDLVAVLTEEMGEQLRRLGVTAPIEVVPLWVDTARISVLPKAPDAPPTILYSGNLGKKQGLRQIVDLAAELERLRPEIRIIVRGNGNEQAALAAELKGVHVGNVRLEGLLAPTEFARGLAVGDIHLVPQDPKGAAFALPSKIFNIMAAGRPFIATAGEATALWRLKQRSHAFVCVPPNDPKSLAEAVLRLIDDRRLAQEMGRRGRDFVETHHSKEAILSRFAARIAALAPGR